MMTNDTLRFIQKSRNSYRLSYWACYGSYHDLFLFRVFFSLFFVNMSDSFNATLYAMCVCVYFFSSRFLVGSFFWRLIFICLFFGGLQIFFHHSFTDVLNRQHAMRMQLNAVYVIFSSLCIKYTKHLFTAGNIFTFFGNVIKVFNAITWHSERQCYRRIKTILNMNIIC